MTILGLFYLFCADKGGLCGSVKCQIYLGKLDSGIIKREKNTQRENGQFFQLFVEFVFLSLSQTELTAN